MRKVIATGLLVLAMAGQAAAGEKFGVLAKGFLDMSQREKLIYAAGVMDAMTIAGVTCPVPVPSYGEVIAMTETQIWRFYSRAEEVWAATAMMAALAERGCKKTVGR